MKCTHLCRKMKEFPLILNVVHIILSSNLEFTFSILMKLTITVTYFSVLQLYKNVKKVIN